MEFSGFPRGVHATPVPDPVLGVLLEQIQDLAELKVTLRGFWLANQKKGELRAVSLDEFLNDKVLVEGLRHAEASPQDAIRNGLELAVKRQTFLVCQPNDNHETTYYAVNTESDRRALAKLKASGGLPGRDLPDVDPYERASEEHKPNIFSLYENNIGTISPMLAEQLKEAEGLYPPAWVNEAFQISVTQNKRSWAYISAILRRWVDEGRGDGESGGYSQKDNATNHLEEYRRLRGHLPWESGDR